MTIRIGLIGAGRMGRVFGQHLVFSIPETELVAVADTHAEMAAALANEFHVQHSLTDYRALLARGDIDAVVVAAPTGLHVEIVCAAAQAGKHIFCEKPLALTLEGSDKAIAAVAKAGVKLQVGFMRRFDPAYCAAKQRIDAGEIGAPVMFKAVGRDPKRTDLNYARRDNSGGLIMDMGIHDFDLARWLMGTEVVRVHTEGDCLVHPELREVGDIDNAVINLRFANDAIGNVDVSRNAVYGYDIRTEVIGSAGALLIGKMRQTDVFVLKPNSVTHDTVPYFMERFADAYAAEVKDFACAIEAERPVAVSGADARYATAIALAATRSLDEGRPISVAEVG